jgi:glycyl-tRNA synthetase
MGREYALRGGERPEVAQAIYEHTLPRFAGDDLAAGKSGILVGLADRLDSLTGLFAIGLAPTGAADPFALRRSALGIVQTLTERGVELDLSEAIRAAADLQPVPVSPEAQREALEFIQRRMEQWWLERGQRHDLVQAVLSARGRKPALAARALRDLARMAETERFKRTLTAYSRPARIVRPQAIEGEADPARFEMEEERRLWEICRAVGAKVSPAMAVSDFVKAFEPLIEPINRFFDEVFVMVEDEAVRHNRLALLKRIADLPEGIVDLTKVQGF